MCTPSVKMVRRAARDSTQISRLPIFSSRVRPPKWTGFSLVELLCVLVMLAVLAGLAMPSFVSGLREERLRSSCRNVISLMRIARSRAATHAETVRLNFDLVEGRFFLSEPEETTPQAAAATTFQPSEREWALVRTHVARERKLPDEVSFLYVGSSPGESDRQRINVRQQELGARTDYEYIEFYPDGTAEETYVAITNTVDSKLVIFLNGVTGDLVILSPEDATALLLPVNAGM